MDRYVDFINVVSELLILRERCYYSPLDLEEIDDVLQFLMESYQKAYNTNTNQAFEIEICPVLENYCVKLRRVLLFKNIGIVCVGFYCVIRCFI